MAEAFVPGQKVLVETDKDGFQETYFIADLLWMVPRYLCVVPKHKEKYEKDPDSKYATRRFKGIKHLPKKEVIAEPTVSKSGFNPWDEVIATKSGKVRVRTYLIKELEWPGWWFICVNPAPNYIKAYKAGKKNFSCCRYLKIEAPKPKKEPVVKKLQTELAVDEVKEEPVLKEFVEKEPKFKVWQKIRVQKAWEEHWRYTVIRDIWHDKKGIHAFSVWSILLEKGRLVEEWGDLHIRIATEAEEKMFFLD